MNFYLIWKRTIFIFLEYLHSVIDIREQYPLLPIEEALTIANKLRI
ncbi:transposon Tn7 transposition protein TnsA [Clostridium botulinum A3 str. Loch Maree]|nr:hypothetical protein [Clostridium botulinum]ACA53743.1 transposon Tn7 transposition protein TnsA [Clostridium botulinum A3 str. Loch Maree]